MKGDMISAILFTMAGFLVWWQEGWWNGAFIFIAAGILYAAEIFTERPMCWAGCFAEYG